MLAKGRKRLAQALGVGNENESAKRAAFDDKGAMKGEFFLDTTEDEADIVRQIIDAQNYFAVLEVDPNDDLDKNEHILRESYMNKCRLLSPNQCNHPRLDEAFEKLSKAYDTLSDPAQRLEHKYQHFGGRPAPAIPGFGNLFSLLGGGPGNGNGRIEVIQLPGRTTIRTGHGQMVPLPQPNQDDDLARMMMQGIMQGLMTGNRDEEEIRQRRERRERRARERMNHMNDDFLGLGNLFEGLGMVESNQRENNQQQQRADRDERRRARAERSERRRAERERRAAAATQRAAENPDPAENEPRRTARIRDSGPEAPNLGSFLDEVFRGFFEEETPRPRSPPQRRQQPSRAGSQDEAEVPAPARRAVPRPRVRDPFEDFFNFPPLMTRNRDAAEEEEEEEHRPVGIDGIFLQMQRSMDQRMQLMQREARERQREVHRARAAQRRAEIQGREAQRRAARQERDASARQSLERLRAMGFEDEDRNRAALVAANGDVEAAIELLLNA